jgi:serine/threonine protein kinase
VTSSPNAPGGGVGATIGLAWWLAVSGSTLATRPGLVREPWDAGLAHRDIKPANLLVRDGRVLLVDAYFVQVRPRRGAPSR